MSFATKRADEFLLGYEKKVRPKSGGGFYSKGGKKKYVKPKSGSGLKNITSAAMKRPEVVVKITSSSKGGVSVRNHLDYIGRNGKVSLETNTGEQLSGKKQANDIKNNWLNTGMIQDKTTTRQTLNIVLSMPAKVEPIKVKDAARAFAKHVFSDHEYVMALHTDTEHPHVHLSVTMLNHDGQRLNPRKNDLFEWRVLFAEKMREQGVDCAATRRQHRGRYQKGEKSAVHHIEKRGGQSFVTQARRKELVEAIKNNQRPLHPFLKAQLDTKKIVVSELKTLARELYIEKMPTEARQISKFLKEIEMSEPTTRAQAAFDQSSERQEDLER